MEHNLVRPALELGFSHASCFHFSLFSCLYPLFFFFSCQHLLFLISFQACVIYLSLKLILIDFSLTVKAASLIFISGPGSAISSAKQMKSGSIYNLVKT